MATTSLDRATLRELTIRFTERSTATTSTACWP